MTQFVGVPDAWFVPFPSVSHDVTIYRRHFGKNKVQRLHPAPVFPRLL